MSISIESDAVSYVNDLLIEIMKIYFRKLRAMPNKAELDNHGLLFREQKLDLLLSL